MKLHKILLPALFLSVAFSACNDIEYYVDEPEMPSDGSIAFGGSVSTMASRAQDANTDIIRASSSGFGVMACLTGEEDYNASTADWIPDFMYNQQVTYINSHWHYEPIKYWPASTTEKVSFFAYWPYTATPEAKDATSSEIVDLSSNDYQGNPLLTFHPGTCPTNHIDLLRASSLNKTNEDGTVAFDFAHALSKVGFRLEPWTDGGYLYGSTITINSLTLTTPYTKATLDLATGEWVKADNDPNTFDLSGDVINHYDFDPVEDDPFVLNASDSFIYMVPETDSSNPDEYEITVDFTYSNGGLPEQTRTYTTTISPSFEAGVSYMIVMRFGDPDITPTDFIQFSISVEKWDSTPLEARLVATQEGMHIAGAMYDRPLGRTYTVTGLYCIDSETVSPDENLLKAPKLITSQTFTLEIDEFEFLKMENGKSYRAEVVGSADGEETVEYQDEFCYQWVITEYTTNAACTAVPFSTYDNTKEQAVVVVNGDAYTSELYSGHSTVTWNGEPIVGQYSVRSGQTDFSLKQCPHWQFKVLESKLQTVDSPLLCSMTDVYYDCFYGCRGLVSLPDYLFILNPQITRFGYGVYGCFYCCSSLETLPAFLFAGCHNASSFRFCFYYCENLTEVPGTLFQDCPVATDFTDCFASGRTPWSQKSPMSCFTIIRLSQISATASSGAIPTSQAFP